MSVRRVVIDRRQWSESSQRSIYEYGSTEYVDIPYYCKACGCDAVFTAEQQREQFEVKKGYIWQRRTLCSDCWNKKKEIQKRLREIIAEWMSNKGSLRYDPMFLKNWLYHLELFCYYGGRRNEANIAMVRKLIALTD